MDGRDHSEECPFCHVWHGGLNETPCSCVTSEVVVMQPAVFTDEALAANDGKTVPLRLEQNGPIVGEATFKYVPEDRALKADLRVADPKVAELLMKFPPSIFG